MERLLFAIIVVLVMMAVAKWKGFSPWRWIFAAGLLGLVILLFLPSARAKGIDEAERLRRRTRGDKVGGVFSAIVLLALFPFMLFVANATGNEDLFVATLLIFIVVVLVAGVTWFFRRKHKNESPVTIASSAVGPDEWHTIRDYSRLFNDARGINYEASLAFALAKITGDAMNRYFLTDHVFYSVADIAANIVLALIVGALFGVVSRFVRRPWILPLVWGAVVVVMGVLLRSGPGLLQAYFGYTGLMVLLLQFVSGALLMAGLIVAVRFWGPTLLSLMAGLLASAIPGVVVGIAMMNVPWPLWGGALIHHAIFAVLFYLGLRIYFSRPLPPPLAAMATKTEALPSPTAVIEAAMPSTGWSRIKAVKVVVESDMLSITGAAIIIPPATLVMSVDQELASSGLITPGEFSDYVSAHGLGDSIIVGEMTDAGRAAMFQTLFPNDKWACCGRVTEMNHRYNIVVAFH